MSQPTEARDRGVGLRHFSEHAVPKLHLDTRSPEEILGYDEIGLPR
jgi:hypothetical protein